MPGVLDEAWAEATDVSEIREKLLGERKWRGGVTEEGALPCDRKRDIEGSVSKSAAFMRYHRPLTDI